MSSQFYYPINSAFSWKKKLLVQNNLVCMLQLIFFLRFNLISIHTNNKGKNKNYLR